MMSAAHAGPLGELRGELARALGDDMNNFLSDTLSG
jgi:hypothetical protein